MYIIIDSDASLKRFCDQTSEHTKMPSTRLRSAIAKGLHCADIKILRDRLSPAPLLYRSPAIDALYAWLRDNVDGDSALHFDNEGNITSEDVMNALPPFQSLHSNTTTGETLPPSPSTDQPEDIMVNTYRQRIADWKERTEETVLMCAEVDSVDELTMDNYEATEDALCDNAKNLANDPNLPLALALLEKHGLTSISEELAATARNGLEVEFLNRVI